MSILATSFLVTAFLIFLAVWRRDIFFYLIASPVAIVEGLGWRAAHNDDTGMVISIAFIGIGLYCLIMAIYNIVGKFK